MSFRPKPELNPAEERRARRSWLPGPPPTSPMLLPQALTDNQVRLGPLEQVVGPCRHLDRSCLHPATQGLRHHPRQQQQFLPLLQGNSDLTEASCSPFFSPTFPPVTIPFLSSLSQENTSKEFSLPPTLITFYLQHFSESALVKVTMSSWVIL